MPKRTSKKKKGKVVNADQKIAQNVGKKLVSNLQSQLGKAGLGKLSIQPGAGLVTPSENTLADTNSQLDASVYTYYSESVNQSTMLDHDRSVIDPTEITIKAELEAEETKELFTNENAVASAEEESKSLADIKVVDVDATAGKGDTERTARDSQANNDTHRTGGGMFSDRIVLEDGEAD